MIGTMKRHTDSNDRKFSRRKRDMFRFGQSRNAFRISEPKYRRLPEGSVSVCAGHEANHPSHVHNRLWTKIDTSIHRSQTRTHLVSSALAVGSMLASQTGSLNHSRNLQSPPPLIVSTFHVFLLYSFTPFLLFSLFSFIHFLPELPSSVSLSPHHFPSTLTSPVPSCTPFCGLHLC